MKIRTILKNGLKKADELVDREADRFDVVSESVSKANSLIQEDAKNFAKNTVTNLKSVAKDIMDVSKNASKEFTDQIKKDVDDVKEIAEKRMIETRDIIKDTLDPKKTVDESEPV